MNEIDIVRDFRSDVPEPDRAATKRARSRVFRAPPRTLRLSRMLALAAALALASSVGFGVGRWTSPTGGIAGVYAGRVTIAAKPLLRPWAADVTLFGAVTGAGAGEKVWLEEKPCGQSWFRVIGIATTAAGGAWTDRVGPYKNTVYRARWKNERSAGVMVRAMPLVGLEKIGPRRFRVGVTSDRYFDGKKVVLQRWNPDRDRWFSVRSATLRRVGPPLSIGAVTVFSGVTFNATVREGVLVRALFPQSQAKPCYAASASKLVRT